MQAQQVRAFVSHSHDDDDFCRSLVAALRTAGADVWYDEHNLGSGQLTDTIDRELRARPIFVLILTPAALRSGWVRDECKWAYTLLRRDPSRLILPVTAAPGVEEDHLPLYLQDFKRVEAPGLMPYPREEAIRRTLHALALTPAGEPPAPAPVRRPTDGVLVYARRQGQPHALESVQTSPHDEPTLRQTVHADLRHGGVLSRALPGYEERAAQIKMAYGVARVLETGDHLICEADGGVGAPLAYLLPIVRSGKVTLISTANKALQEQLFYKDIPFVQRHVQPFKAALVKGMGNYLCLDCLPDEQNFQQLVKHRAFSRMEALLDDPDAPGAWDGDFDTLTESLSPEVRGRLGTSNEDCAWRACNWFAECYVRKMRDRSHDAQVIVVDHALLLLDVALGGFLLPERDVIVIDEAHHLEEEATRAFTVTVSAGRVASLLALRRLRDHADPRLQQEAADADVHLWAALMRDLRVDARGWQLLTAPLEEGLRLASAIDTLASSLTANRPPNQDDKEEQLYEKLVRRTRGLATDLRVVFGRQSVEDRVYYVEMTGGMGRRAAQPSASAAPLHVTELLREKLFDKIPTISTASALSIGGESFSFYRSRVRLEDAKELVLPLTFNYREHALLYVPRMKREPAYGAASGPYLDELAEQMRDLVAASEGRAFLLFSSNNALRGVYERLEAELEAQDFNLLVEGPEMTSGGMLLSFLTLPRAVLFGLASHWETVAIPGKSLALVALDQLPIGDDAEPSFDGSVGLTGPVPAPPDPDTDPVLGRAMLHVKAIARGLLPSPEEERRVMAILDRRLRTEPFGRAVLNQLPPARRSDVMADVRRFLSEE